jgi:uncharacterized protein (TIGR00730 family)
MNKIVHADEYYRDPDFVQSLEGRTLRILSEYLGPMATLDKHKVNSTILFLGSAKASPMDSDSPLYRYYWEIEELSYLLAKWAVGLRKPKGKDFVVCTGGGPGMMEAANRGAARAGADTIGMNIALPQAQQPNPYITPDLSFTFHYFFMRKFWLTYKARAVVICPGGYGTLDEFFEIITRLQTSKISKKEMTVILYGEDYWRQVIQFENLVKMKAICADDLDLFKFCSSPREALAFLKKRLSILLQ